MPAIEGLHDRLGERRILRISNHHPCPGDGLKKGPVQPNRTGQRQGNQKLGQAREHDGTLPLANLTSRDYWRERAHGGRDTAIESTPNRGESEELSLSSRRGRRGP